MSLPQAFSEYTARMEKVLDGALPASDSNPRRLHQAMRYSVLGGGKRLRPCLVYATGEALGLPLEKLDAPALAVELIHAYSLIHDDLPAMDDDDLRRGQPTCHKAFDEATAVLAGDALQTLAFQSLTADYDKDAAKGLRQARMVGVLAGASGTAGMIGGQMLDMAATGRSQSLDELKTMHELKTGALIQACTQLACLCRPDASAEQTERLDNYGRSIGLAFQIQDDVLDEESDTETLGKTQGADQEHGKSTFPSLIGLEQSKKNAEDLVARAIDCLDAFDDKADNLRALARYIVERDH